MFIVQIKINKLEQFYIAALCVVTRASSRRDVTDGGQASKAETPAIEARRSGFGG